MASGTGRNGARLEGRPGLVVFNTVEGARLEGRPGLVVVNTVDVGDGASGWGHGSPE